MRWSVARVPKIRNCPPVHLALGIEQGLRDLGEEVQLFQMPTITEVDPCSISGTDVLVVPYWIGEGVFKLNLGEVRSNNPGVKIVTYTGVAPYYDGCRWASYDRMTGTVSASPYASSAETANLEAIDLCAVVFSESASSLEREVGMGLGSDPLLTEGQKSPKPVVLLDHLKIAWDEQVFDEACSALMIASKAGWQGAVIALGSAAYEHAKMRGVRVSKGFKENTPFEDIVALYKTSWAFLAHNESFGYPLVECPACGTEVFVSSSAQTPTCHSGVITRWSSAEELASKILSMSQPESSKSVIAARQKNEYHSGLFSDWLGAAKRLLSAVSEL